MRGSKRQRKKIAKRLARAKPFEILGTIFADAVMDALALNVGCRPWVSDDEALAQENEDHPWWTRTKRR